MKRFSLLAVTALAALSISLAGCGGNNDNPPRTRLRVINAITGTPDQPIDVLVNGQVAIPNVAVGNEAGGVEVNAGNSVPISIRAANTTTVLTSGNVALTANIDQPVLVSGLSGVTTGANRVQVVALGRQNLGSTPANGQSRFYFVNAAPEATNVTLNFTPPGGTATTNADLTNVPYLQMTPEQLTNFGSNLFSVTASGQTINLTPPDLVGSKTYLVLLLGRPTASGGNPDLNLKVVQLN